MLATMVSAQCFRWLNKSLINNNTVQTISKLNICIYTEPYDVVFMNYNKSIKYSAVVFE